MWVLYGGPLGPLVADEPFEDVLAQGLGHELRALHVGDGLVEAAGQGPDLLGGQFLGRHGEQVGGRLAGQLVALLDALQAGGQDDGEGQIGVAGRVGGPVLDAGGLDLVALDQGHPDQRRAVVAGPGDVDGRLVAR